MTEKKLLIEDESILESLPFYILLVYYSMGEIDKDVLISRTELISSIRDKIITIQFESEVECFKLLYNDVDDYTQRQIEEIFNHYGYSSGYYDSYQVVEDWSEGHIIKNFNSSQDEILEKILYNLLIDSEISDKNKAKVLNDQFPREVEDIIEDYHYRLEDSMEEYIKEELINDYDILTKLGFTKIAPFYKYTISLDDFIKLFESDKLNGFSMTLEEVFKSLGAEESVDLSGVNDNFYYRFTKENEEKHELKVTTELNNMLEKAEEFNNEFSEKFERLPSKFKFFVWYELPKDNKYMFKMTGIDFEDDYKIKFSVKDKGVDNHVTKLKKSLDNFINFLYQPELF